MTAKTLTVFLVLGVLAAPAASAFDPQKARVPLADIPGLAAPPARPVGVLREQPEVQKLYEEALQLVGEGKYARAMSRLDEALDAAEGDYYELPYLMAVVKYRTGDLGEARTFAELAAALRPGAADVHYLLGMLYQRQDRLDRATKHFRTATLAAKHEPDNPKVTASWGRLGERLATEGYWTAACEAYARFDQAIWQTHPEHRDEQEVAALLVDRPHGMITARLKLLGRLDNTAGAVRAAEESLARQPDDPCLRRLYARALLDAGRAEEALVFCRERLAALASDPDTAENAPFSPLVSLSVSAAVAANELEPWLDEILQSVAGGERIELTEAVARRLTDAGQHAAAGRVWRAILAQRPDDADAAWALAAALQGAGQLEPALTSLIEFVRQHPEIAEVPDGRLKAWNGSFDKTSELLRLIGEWRDRQDHDFAGDLVLGAAAAATEQTELAEKLFGAALTAHPDFALGRVLWGRMLASEYRWEDAKAQAQAALEINPDLAAAHFVLALVHAGLDQGEQAEKAFQAALKLRPNDPGYALALALHYRRTGNLLASQRYFQQALTADPTDAEALEDSIDSYLGGGKIDIARAQLRQAETRDLPEDVLRPIRTAVRYARTPFQDQHLAELTRQFEEFPDDAGTGLILAVGLYLRNRSDEAYAALQRVIALTPNDERALSLMARVHARRLEYDAAIGILEEFARRYPNRRDVHTLLAETCLADFRLDEARGALRRLLDSNLDERARFAYRQRLLLSYVEFSDFEEALPLLDEWIKEDPEDDRWSLEKLRVLLLAGRQQEAIDLAAERVRPAAAEFEKALEGFKRVVQQIQENPDDRGLLSRAELLQTELGERWQMRMQRRGELIQIYMDARRFKAAEEYLHRWLTPPRSDDDESTTWLSQLVILDYAQNTEWLVQALIADERPDEALEALKGLDPPSPAAGIAIRGWRAQAEAAAGRPDRAAAELESLLEERDAGLTRLDRADIWQRLMQTLVRAGHYDKALECCEKWFAEVDRGDEHSRVLLLSCRGSILMQADRTDEYIAVAEELLKLDPDDTGLNNDLGYTWVDEGKNLERATRMIRKAVADEPLRAAYLDSLGWAYYKTDDFAAAQEYLNRAARLREGQDAVIYDHLADAEYRLGDVQAARRHWQRALELAEEQEPNRAVPVDPRVVAGVRGKLAAIASSKPAEVAPTADEQARERE